MKLSVEGLGTWIGATLGVALIAIIEVLFTGVGVHFLSDVFMQNPISFPDAMRAGAGLLIITSTLKRLKS